ncbi:hypothetical protein HDV00_003775 [Rhizophlyctis rosea]|nr:hypothetical protein HDV00_003775 [Rhizophlyctis rosea]
MRIVANILHALPGAEWLSFPDEVKTFSVMMKDQLDLRSEADHLRRFAKDFEKRENVSFPEPVGDLIRKDVLVETFSVAIPVVKFLNEGPTVFDHDLADIGLMAFLRMLIIDNFTHADLHPGNILVTFKRPIGKSILGRPTYNNDPANFIDYETVKHIASLPPAEFKAAVKDMKRQGLGPHLIFLDAGLVSELSPENLTNFLDLFYAIAEFNGTHVADLMVERSRTPWTVTDPYAFRKDMEKFLARIRAETLQLSKIKVGEILATVFNMVRNHHIKIEGDFANVGISIMLLEGIGRRLDPNMDLLHEALPVLREAAKLGIVGGVKQGVTGKEAMPASLGKALSWDVYVKVWLYKWVRPLLLIGDEFFEQERYEDARQFFPDF